MINRLMRFGTVGLLCLCIQLIILNALDTVLPALYANGIGFIASAQLNFVLSYNFTWHDSERKTGYSLAATWLQFNMVVFGATLINGVAFGLIHHFLIHSNIITAVIATAISTVGTFSINHLFVLRPKGANDGNNKWSGHFSSRVERSSQPTLRR